jgi:hypothetical protein
MEIKQGLHLLRENVAPGKGLCSEQPPLPDPPTQLVHERLNRSFEKEFPSNGSLQLKIRQKEIVHHTSDLLDDDDDNDDDIEASDAGDDSSSLRAASLEVLAPHSAPSSPLSGAEEDHITGDWDLQRPYSSGSASLATDSRASRLPPETRTRKHISSKPLILDPDVAFSLLG